MGGAGSTWCEAEASESGEVDSDSSNSNSRGASSADLIAEATKLAQEMANGPKALGLIRNLMWQSLDADWTDQLANERRTQTVAGKTDDFIEGVKAFLEKRPAAFQGR